MLIRKLGIQIGKIRGNDAQGMVEFAIVFPVLFLFFLGICQAAMLHAAQQVVQYAAFCAARSAVVWIPEKDDPLGPIGAAFELNSRPNAPAGAKSKYDKIDKSAALACLSIAEDMDPLGYATFIPQAARLTAEIMLRLQPTALQTGIIMFQQPELITHFQDKVRRFGSVNNFLGDLATTGLITAIGQLPGLQQYGPTFLTRKYVYARFFTNVAISAPGKILRYFPYPHFVSRRSHARNHFGAGQDIAVAVTHYYSMKIPVINKLIFTAYMSAHLPSEFLRRLRLANFAYQQGTNLGFSVPFDLSEGNITRMMHMLHEKIDEISENNTVSFYPIPITASATLTVEGNRDWSALNNTVFNMLQTYNP